MEQERQSDLIFEPVLRDEMKAIMARRKKINPAAGGTAPSDLFGIALSGGGIRSATINLGVLEVLNKCGILKLADYLSTVSGGGYIGGYVHATLNDNDCAKDDGLDRSYTRLFHEDHIEHFKNYGYYLAPGSKFPVNVLNRLRLAGGFAASFLMNLVWVFAFFFSVLLALKGIYRAPLGVFPALLILVSGAVLAYHFFCHPLRYLNYKLWPTNVLNYTEGILLALLVLFGPFLLYRASGDDCATPCLWYDLLYALLVLFVTGFFANPNLLTMHRFYRDRIATAFMKAAGSGDGALRLHQLAKGGNPEAWHCAPYPLINTCLNLQGSTDDKFNGTKTSDYFLLSPLYCGSKLTGYARTNTAGYKSMTLSTAVAASGAAVNPEMGTSTNKALAFLMTLLNLRLGYWAVNPKRADRPFFSRLVWWPYYHVMELLSKTDTKKRRVNISDGGHIENLAIYELLRRRCKLILAVDASADPRYEFSDLRNLAIRARNELGLEINFRQRPEQVIAPEPSVGFSKQHCVLADIKELPVKSDEAGYTGVLVYVKASLLAGRTWKITDDESYFYKTYHPAFPHESTADQFFDAQQWSAYYHLGKFTVGNFLGVVIENNPGYGAEVVMKNTTELCHWFTTRLGTW